MPIHAARKLRRVVALASLSGILGAAGCAAAAGGYEIAEVASGNYVHYGEHAERSPRNLGDNANAGFVVGERCVAVVDTGGSFAVGQRLREAIRATTPLPVCYVILTHVHPDHLLGAAAFLADAPQFVGHAQLPRSLAARGAFYLRTLERDLGGLAQGSAIVPPSVLVEQRMLIDLGGRRLQIDAWPVSHSDNDLTVLDQSTGTLWLSDLLFAQHIPVVDGSILGFLQVLERLREVPANAFVPGHGRSALSWPAALDAEQRYLKRIVGETRQALTDGKTLQEAVDSVGYAEAGNWINFELFHRRNVTSAYTELEWEE